jgi:hypothetical protein
MAVQDDQFLSCVSIPDPRGPVFGSRRYPGAVRARVNSSDKARVTEQRKPSLASVSGADRPSSPLLLADHDWLAMTFLWLGQAYARIVDGKATAKEALRSAQEMANSCRACVIVSCDFARGM